MQDTVQPCSLCLGVNSKKILTSSTRPGAIFYHCSQCDLIFLNEKQLITAEDEKARYGFHQNSKDNTGYIQQFADLRAKLVELLPKNASILDFGCGPEPVLSQLLQEDGFQCQAYDPFFFPRSELLQNKYDAVVSTEVIEHFHYPQREFQKILSLLKSQDSLLCVQTKFHKPEINFDNWWYVRDLTHVCFYSQNTFRWLSTDIKKRVLHMQDPLVIFK